MNMTELDGVFILNTFITNYNIRILYIKQDRYIGINKPFSNLFNQKSLYRIQILLNIRNFSILVLKRSEARTEKQRRA